MLTLCALGDHRNRQPFAYGSIRSACAGAFRLTDDPYLADAVILAHAGDLAAESAYLAHLQSRLPDLRVVLLSEEPFWDTVWAPDPLTRRQIWPGSEGPVPFSFLNHHTSQIFDFARIPYFLLTDPAYCARYASLFPRNAARSVADWRRHFDQADHDLAFMFERRRTARYAPSFPRVGLFGLSSWRTRLALACDHSRVLRAGRGWAPGPRRQELPDWHADKLDRLDGRCRMVAALENTHQRTYVTEKLFDAYAVGAAPVYCAAPGHAVERLAVPGSWLNLYDAFRQDDLTPPRDIVEDQGFLPAFQDAQASLAALFTDPDAVPAELARLCAALQAEFDQTLQDSPD